MFSEAAMAKLWDSMGIAEVARTHKAQDEAFGWVRCSHWR
jgi:hypothetical protein